MTQRIWIVTTDRKSWAKAHNLHEAIMESIRLGGDMIESGNVHELNATHPDFWARTRINEEGMLVSTEGVIHKDHGSIDLKPIAIRYFTLIDLITEKTERIPNATDKT